VQCFRVVHHLLRMRTYNPIVVIIILFLFNSCNGGYADVPIITVHFDNSEKTNFDSVVNYAQDSIRRDIPKFYRLQHVQNEKQKIESAIKIGSLVNGFPGQQIRILGNEYDEYNDWERLIVFTNKSSWRADVYYIRYAAEDDLIMVIDSLQYQKHSIGQPKSGWRVFIDSLSHYGLFSLPHYTAIPGYVHESTHELTYEVEVASHNNYRIYSLLNPIIRQNRFPEAKKFTQILGLIKRQFSFPNPQLPKIK
jgi:hypothetical protein